MGCTQSVSSGPPESDTGTTAAPQKSQSDYAGTTEQHTASLQEIRDFFEAADKGNVGLIASMLTSGFPVDTREQEPDTKRTALHSACWSNQLQVVKKLLDGTYSSFQCKSPNVLFPEGANVNLQCSDGRTPLHETCESLEDGVDEAAALLEVRFFFLFARDTVCRVVTAVALCLLSIASSHLT